MKKRTKWLIGIGAFIGVYAIGLAIYLPFVWKTETYPQNSGTLFLVRYFHKWPNPNYPKWSNQPILAREKIAFKDYGGPSWEHNDFNWGVYDIGDEISEIFLKRAYFAKKMDDGHTNLLELYIGYYDFDNKLVYNYFRPIN